MAGRKEIDFSYSLTDRVIRLALGELADFSGAKYDGDFTQTLKHPQRPQHGEAPSSSISQRRVVLGCG